MQECTFLFSIALLFDSPKRRFTPEKIVEDKYAPLRADEIIVSLTVDNIDDREDIWKFLISLRKIYFYHQQFLYSQTKIPSSFALECALYMCLLYLFLFKGVFFKKTESGMSLTRTLLLFLFELITCAISNLNTLDLQFFRFFVYC